MTTPEISGLITAIAQFLLGFGAVSTAFLTWKNGQKSKERSEVISGELKELHKSTNSLSERNEAIAKKLGIEEGKKQAAAGSDVKLPPDDGKKDL